MTAVTTRIAATKALVTMAGMRLVTVPTAMRARTVSYTHLTLPTSDLV